MTAQRFEDLRIWQDSRIQANEVYDAFGPESASARDFGFRDQIQRAAVSVMNNIAEGFERKSDPDFARFLDIAKGSNGEVRSMLYLAEDRSYLVVQEAIQMRAQSEQLSRAIESLAKHLRR
jgi:four helix bundle protein